MGVTLMILVAVCLCLMLSVATVAELQAKREEAGKVLIQLRDECQAEGFQETPEFSEKWDKAEAEYTSALQAEEQAIAAEENARKRSSLAARIESDAKRLGALNRSRFKPDYDPSRDPRTRAVSALPMASEWSRSLNLWASVRSPSVDPFDLEAEDRATLKRCRVNLLADEFRLPTGPAIAAMVSEMQDVFMEFHPRHRARAIREVLASWNTMTPESAAYVAEPPQVLRQLEVNRLAWGGILQVATVRTTTTGEDILLPFTDDTSVRGRRITEDGPLGTEVSPRFGQIRWGSYKYTSDVIAVTYEMLRDAFIDLENFIGEIGGQRLGRIENYEATHGTGNSMPRGIVFAAPVGVTTASATAITYDEVIDLEMSVDDAYQSDRTGFMMNKGILKYLRKLKDLEGRPLLQLGQETGGRDSLNGKPIFINYDMADSAVASADVMLYGDFSKYWIRRVGGTRVVRDPYTQRISNDRDLFAAVEYMDGNLINTGTAPVKKMRMHA